MRKRRTIYYIVNNGKLKEEEACHLFQQIINGLEYLNEKWIIHRDLKPEIILTDNNLNIKILDFLVLILFMVKIFIYKQLVKILLMLEMLKGNEYNGTSSDIWSCRIICKVIWNFVETF